MYQQAYSSRAPRSHLYHGSHTRGALRNGLPTVHQRTSVRQDLRTTARHSTAVGVQHYEWMWSGHRGGGGGAHQCHTIGITLK